MSRPSRVPLWWALSILAVLVLGAGNAFIWWPLWNHWHVAPAVVDAAAIGIHRSLPADSVLATVAETSMMTDHPLRGEAAVAAAKRLLVGELALPQLPVVRIDPGFSPRDLEQGVPVQQLFIASLIVPDLLLRAHEHRPDPAYVAAARRYLLGFVAHEAKVHFPANFERNSHAVANRASVLARYWRHTRKADASSDPGDADSARIVHLHAQRVAALLSRPSHFIASTNHGVMQNVALLQLAAAFPALPDAAAHRTLALHRLALQLPFYIAPDGAVLEHSAGYHFHGVVLSGYVIALLQASGQPVPPQWVAAHARTLSFMTDLQRPDRSMPQYGNTYRYAWTLPPVLGIDAGSRDRKLRERGRFTKILPVSGHAVWWDARSSAGAATHTLVPWGYFAGHGHRRAQELSLLVWSDGTDWSTNTGYWPGSDPAGVALAGGWAGGNGPHVVGEAPDGARRSALLAHADDAGAPERQTQGDGAGFRFLDIERVATEGVAGGVRVRRQIVQWQGSIWIVLDTYADAAKRALRVVWTSAPEATQRRTGERQFRLERTGSTVAMNLSVEGSDGVTALPLQGSRDPFGGWVAFDRKAVAAPGVDARLPTPEGWILGTVDLAAATSPTVRRAKMVRYGGPEDWEVRLAADGQGAGVTMTRTPQAMHVRAGSETRSITLLRGEPVDEALAAIERSRAALLAAYPRFRTQEWERRRYSTAFSGLWLLACLSVIALMMLRERRRPLRP